MSAVGRVAFTFHYTHTNCNDSDVSYMYPEILESLYYFEMVATGVSVAVLLVVVGYLVFVERLKTTIHFLEAFICTLLLSNQTLTFFGVLVSPCQPFSLTNGIEQKTYESVCIFFSFFICFSMLSLFAWLAILSAHACWNATQACQLHIYNAVTGADDLPSDGGNQRKVSRGELEKRSQDFSSRRSLYDLFDMMWTSGSSNGDSPSAGGKRMAGGEEKGDLIREWYIVWFVEWYSRRRLPRWMMILVGFLPAAILCSISLATISSEGVEDTDMSNLDTFCWPGTESGMMWYMIGFVPIALLISLYFYTKGLEMVRIIEGTDLKSLQSIDKWLKEREKEKLYGRQEKKDKTKIYYLHQSLGQIQVITFSWFISILKEFYMWGCVIPSATMSYVIAFTLFRDNVLHAKKFQDWMNNTVLPKLSSSSLAMVNHNLSGASHQGPALAQTARAARIRPRKISSTMF